MCKRDLNLNKFSYFKIQNKWNMYTVTLLRFMNAF